MSRNISQRIDRHRHCSLHVELLEPRCLLSATVETEPNDTSATANALPNRDPTAIVSGSINPVGDFDFMSFPASVGDRIWGLVDTGSPPAATGTSRDSVLNLFAPDGNTFLETDDEDGTGNGGDAIIETGSASVIAGHSLTTAGTHFFRVVAFGTGTIIPYKLFVAQTNASDESAEAEPNDTSGTATPILQGSQSAAVRTANLAAGESDFYSFQADAGDIVFIAADGDPERDGNTSIDFELRGPDGSTVLITANSGFGSVTFLAEGLNFVIPADGAYFVRVFGETGAAAGTYDLMVARNAVNDYGDAPDPRFATPGRYPTLRANNGARHTLGSGLFLGSSVDPDADGQPNATASGDGADDDGVVLSQLVAGLGATATVIASQAGKLDAFLDFNADGDWDDAGEQIATSRNVSAGSNAVTFPVPEGAVAGATFARFRLSSAGGLGPAGAALDGEVEDYQVTITVPADNSAVVMDHPQAPGFKLLLIVGSESNDKISLKPGDGTDVELSLNRVKQTFDASTFEQIVVFAKGGGDKVKLDTGVGVPAFVFAGDGADHVKGGGGNQVLVGGPGDDKLAGGALNDVLIGGAGADQLTGGKGKSLPDRDLLIGGPTAHDNFDLALAAILDEWTDEPDYLTAVTALRGGTGGVPAIDATTVPEDSAVDTLKGGLDLDWFVAGAGDKMKDRGPGEQLDLNGVPQLLRTAAVRPSLPVPDATFARIRRRK